MDLPKTIVDAPKTVVGVLRCKVGLLKTIVDARKTIVGALSTNDGTQNIPIDVPSTRWRPRILNKHIGYAKKGQAL